MLQLQHYKEKGRKQGNDDDPEALRSSIRRSIVIMLFGVCVVSGRSWELQWGAKTKGAGEWIYMYVYIYIYLEYERKTGEGTKEREREMGLGFRERIQPSDPIEFTMRRNKRRKWNKNSR